MDFTIEIDFSSDALDAIAGQFVTLVRPVLSFVSSRQFNVLGTAPTPPKTTVAWLAFSPMQANRIEWMERCDVYSTAVVPSLLGVIDVEASTTIAQPGETWALRNGHFSLESASAPSDYHVRNQQSDTVCLGLIAAATVNGAKRPAAPLNIQKVLLNEKV